MQSIEHSSLSTALVIRCYVSRQSVVVFQRQTGVVDRGLNPTSGAAGAAAAADQRGQLSCKSDSLGDGSLTSKVGTALYVSPEVMNTSAKTHYDQVRYTSRSDGRLVNDLIPCNDSRNRGWHEALTGLTCNELLLLPYFT